MRLYRSKLTSRLHFNIDSVGDIQIHSPVSKQELAGALVTAAHPMPARSTARRSCPQSVNVGCREDMLKRELADITRRGQAAEARHEELASAMPEATRPLLRQIEAMQAAAAAHSQAWAAAERSLHDRLSAAEAQAAASGVVTLTQPSDSWLSGCWPKMQSVAGLHHEAITCMVPFPIKVMRRAL